MPCWTDARAAAALIAALALAGPAWSQAPAPPGGAPLSSNDWLSGRAPQPSRSMPAPSWRPGQPVPPDAQRRRPRPAPGLGPVAKTGAVAPVGVTRLSDGNPDAKGTLSAAAAGLPADLWGNASAGDAARALAGYDPQLPATRQAFLRLLTAQVAPPTGSAAGDEGSLFLARIDRLIALGQLPAARALAQAAGAGNAPIVGRRFDIALITGEEGALCETIGRKPGLAPGFGARIFCLAQAGDWAAAALTLHGARADGLIPPTTVALLEAFLDDGAVDAPAEGEGAIPATETVTPLDFRLHEAIGEPLSTTDLPLAFAHADLRANGGWKARIEAAERLSRAGALDPATLAQAYSEQAPAASGGVWDRAAAWQDLDRALTAQDAAAAGQALERADRLFADGRLTPTLAAMVAARLPATGMTDEARSIAARLRLIAGLPVTDADASPLDRWLSALAHAPGTAAPLPPPPAEAPAAAADFAAALSPPASGGPAEGAEPPSSRGLALIAALADVDAGASGDQRRAAAGLSHLVRLGQATLARQAAVELLVLDPARPRP
ncbi:hypothetical protein [Paracoccus endophyticus]|uniref:hypothetical protein n=1 Tax=Paracoccus endophyticus TaxID=2233774 RepID=UPI000DD8FB73|nr:hypothetical protein [Paracoccus endophyticus]